MKGLLFRLYSVLLGFGVLAVFSCQKEITVDLPKVEPRIVVEGTIEQGQPPIVLLTWSQGYFDPVDLNAIQNMYIKGATVQVSNGAYTSTLTEICTADLPPDLLAQAAELLGLPPDVLAQFNICGYIGLDPLIWGEINKVYTLTIDYQDKHLEATTKINNLVAFDSLWFKILSNGPQDSLGFIFGTITDPDTAGNAYRWYARRINRYPQWVEQYDPQLVGQPKDLNYIAPLGSVIDDQFFNGLSFEFGYYRGFANNSAKYDDLNAERGYFKKGDTVAIKGCVIDRGVYQFLSDFEDQLGSAGSPFSTPYNLRTNINGGLGLWAGYGAVYDTVICK